MSRPHQSPHHPATIAAFLCVFRKSILFLALFLFSSPGSASFEILSGTTEIGADALETVANIKLDLGDAAAEALNRGIDLHLLVELKLYRVRPFIWDDNIGKWMIGYKLKYHSLSNSYVLIDDLQGGLETFSTLRDAMDSLSPMRVTLPVIMETLPETGYGYRVSMRITLDRESLPPPLQLITEISSAWDLDSDWKQWPVSE